METCVSAAIGTTIYNVILARLAIGVKTVSSVRVVMVYALVRVMAVVTAVVQIAGLANAIATSKSKPRGCCLRM